MLNEFKRLGHSLSCVAIACVLSLGAANAALAQQDGTDSTTSTDASTQPATSVTTLSEFVQETLTQMGVQAGTAIQGLSDAAETAVLAKLNQLNTTTVTTSITMRGVVFDVIRYTPTGAQKPYLVLHAPKLMLSNLVPQAAGTPLAALGELDDVFFIYAPAQGPKTLGAPAFTPSDGDATPPAIITKLQSFARSRPEISPGMNFAATLPIISAPREIKDLMRAVGIASSTKLPLRGGVDPAIFKEAFSNAPKVQTGGLQQPAQMKTAFENLARTYGKDFLQNINLSAGVPTRSRIGPFDVTGEAFRLKGDGAGGINFGLAAEKLSAFEIDITNALFTYESGQKAIVASGTVDTSTLEKIITFRGLTFDSVSLATSYQQDKWDFTLEGKGKLNSAEITLDIIGKSVPGQKADITATLSGAQTGITAADVAGRALPGFDKVALTKVRVSRDRLVADLTFGTKSVPGEIAAFHVGAQTSATMAMTLDQLAFSELVPGSAGSPLDGVSVGNMSLIVVPAGGAGLKPDDAVIPEKIRSNVAKVITAASKNDPTKSAMTLAEGFNLLADLDIQSSQSMGDLMKSAGVAETVIPIIGMISTSTFQPGVPKADSLKGLDLSFALPDLRLPGAPDTINFTKPVFAIGETAPAALKQSVAANLKGPFVTIGVDLQMQAGKGTHDFASLLMVGKNQQGQRVIDLTGSAKDPKDLFEFKGLEVKTIDFASVYDAGNWDFKFNGSADLNTAPLTFETNIQRVDGKVVYTATLSGGANGISAKDVAGRDVPGLDKVTLTKVTVEGDRLVADMTFGPKKTPGELAAFHVGSQANATLAFTLDKLVFTDLVPGSAGTALDGVEVDDLSLIVVPSGGAGLKPDDPAVPPHITDNLKKVIADAARHDPAMATYALADGFNVLADLELNASRGMGDLMKSAGLSETTVPIIGVISASTFQPNVPKAESIKGLKLDVALPDLRIPGLPSTFAITKPVLAITEIAPTALTAKAGAGLQGPFVTVGMDLKMVAGKGTHDFASLLVVGKDAQGKRVIDLTGSAKDPQGLFEFKGLTVKTLDLASVYDGGNWDFKVDGTATLNTVELTFETDIQRVDNKVVYVATLSGGSAGISARDVAGRELPGLDKVALTKVTVTGEQLLADMVFGTKKTPGELAAFHVGTQANATLAFTLDKLAFADLVPGSAGSALDGVEVDDLTLVIVPDGGTGLKPDDTAMPQHIADNLKKVIADAAKHDPSKAAHTLATGFNLLADLDIKASGAMSNLMASAGITETVMPIIGTVSASTFVPNAPKTESIKNLDLSVALPDLRVPGLPSTMTITNPVFAVTEVAPAALKKDSATALTGPFVTLGLDLKLAAGRGVHDFAGLMMVGKDEQGKRIIDLLGSAKDPKGLFEFKGLTVKDLDLASVYDAGNWDFKLSGSADLNAAALTFETDIKRIDNKVVYVATLDGGANGISAKDVAGRDLPGLDKVALTKVVVTGDELAADMVFGAKKTPGELAAFHVGEQTNATMAFTLDKLAFADFVPGSAGSALDGVEVDDLTLVIVPDGGAGLKPDDPAFPTEITANLKKVIADAAQHDPKKATYTLAAGFNLLADLDIKASSGMGALMASAGVTETVVPIIGEVSASTFVPNAPKVDSVKGLNLEVALPDLKVPGLPSTITITKPVFSITETAPTALTAAASGVAKADLQAPFVTIGADLQMQAGAGTHDFASILMVGKDAQGKRIVDLVGSAKDPKGLFEFKGLTVKTLDLASIYDAGNWDFKLDGSADLNAAAITFNTDIKKIDNNVVYVATLDGGANGISAKDVAGRDLPGLDKVALTKVTVTAGRLVADMVFGAKKTPGELAAFHVGTQTNATMAFTLDKLAFADLVPGSAGSALDGVEADDLTLVVVPDGGAGLKPDDPNIPSHISDSLKKVIADAAKHDPTKATYTLASGFNLLADLDIKASGGMGDLMKSAGVTETVIPIIGEVSASTFVPNVPKADSIKGLNLEVALPDLKVPGLPSTITITKPIFAVTETAPTALTKAVASAAQGPFVTVGLDLNMVAGKGTHDFDALLMVGKDDKGKRVVDLVGSAKDPKDLFEFKGLSVKTLDLASVYDAGNWDFKLDGSADLNKTALTFATEIQKVDNKVTYVATLDGGAKGISAKDVAGRDIPGMDTVALTKVIVTGDRLVADLTFGAKKTPGEIAAFHPTGADHAVIAITLDKLAFADLVPGSAGSSLDGVEIDDLAMMIVPEKSAGLKPSDPAIPEHIRDNLAKVLADAAKHDPSKSSYALKSGFNLLADLDLKASGGMGTLMKSAGVTEVVLPIVGTISSSTFKPSAPKKEALAGLDLEVALPDLKVPGLPSTITITNPIFSVTDQEPAALTAAASAIATGNLDAPFVTIGAGLKMVAGKGEHDFDALLMVGKDAKSKRVVELLGSAKDPKGLFEFKGLTVETLNLASIYDAGVWDFQLNGTADLNKAAIDFDTEITNKDNKVEYIATLSAKNGISAKDVAGRDVPGFDTVALTKVVVTGNSLAADMTFGKKKTPGEIAAFHPANADKAVMAITLDKLAFADMVPGAASGALNGVDVDDLSIIVVPEKSAGLKPDDESIPAHIQANLKKVLTDASRTSYTLKKDINLFADLDISGATLMQDFMSFIGRDGKKPIAIVGAMSPQLFNPRAPAAQKFDGMDLSLPMPGLDITGLPDAFTLKNTSFKVTDQTPSGSKELWVGLKSDMDADLLGSEIAFDMSVGFAKSEIFMAATSEQELKKPFGIHWLDLKKLAISIDYDKKTKSGELKFTSIPAKPFGKHSPEIEIDLVETGGKLSAGLLKVTDTVPFSDLPILKKVKHADQFNFTFMEISTSGISGGSLLHGQKVDAVVFEQSAKWTFAVSDNGGGKGFKFDRLMPVLKKTPLKDFHLNDAALIFSEDTIVGKVTDLPGVAQTVFTDIYGSADAAINVINGITVAANFSPGSSGGFVGKGMQGIGVHDDILIEGGVINIFGDGSPGIDVLVDIEQGPGGKKGATHTPKMAKFPGQVGFFIQYQADELDVGLQADVFLDVPKKETLDLITKLELQLDEKGFAVDIFMDLKGQWKNPWGIPGFELDEVAIKFGIDMEGEANFGVKGVTVLGSGVEKISMAAEMDFLLEAAGLPDGIAMVGSISELGIPVIIEIAEGMAGGKAKVITDKDLPLPEFKKVKFGFATPGMSDPQLGIVGDGFALGGELFFLGRELGAVNMSAGPSGINMDAKVDPIDFKVLKLDKNTMKFDLGFTSAPKLEIDSEIEFLGAKQAVLVGFDKGMMDFGFEDKIGGGIWDSKINLGLGVNDAAGDAPDIFVEGEVKSDFFKWLRDQAPAKVREFFNKLNADFEKAKEGINNAEAVVRSWNSQIAARKAVIQRERANADRAIQSAQNRVNSVNSNANHMHDEYEHHKHRCHWYSAWHCAEAGYYWGRYEVERAAYWVARRALDAAKATVDHLPSELMDPQLDYLEGKQAAAMAALEIAKGAIDGVEEADSWMASGLSTLLKRIGDTDALVIKEIFFEADMDGMVKGRPAIMSMDLEIFGEDLGTQIFAFKLTDPVFDAEQLAFIPLHMVSELFQNELPHSLRKLLGPVLQEINTQSRNAEKKVHEELKDLPGLNLPPELKQALEAASLDLPGTDAETQEVDHAALPLDWWRQDEILDAPGDVQTMRINVAANDNSVWTTSAPMEFAQATGNSPDTPAPTQPGTPAASTTEPATSASGAANNPVSTPANAAIPGDPVAAHKSKLEAFKEKRRNLLLETMNRNKGFGQSLVDFQNEQQAARQKNENDEFVAYTDIHVPPGELFTEKLLVARHSKLCLGQNGQGKTTFHPCSENPGGLLWSTRRVLIDRSGKVIQYNAAFAKQWPSRVYTQLLHNGACLTTPFHLATYDNNAKKDHAEKLDGVAGQSSDHPDAHLKMEACNADGKGQLWKVVKDVEGDDGVHGFKLQERDSSFCLRPGTVKAQTKKTTKEVNGVFYPCSGIAHGTFELTVPNNDMPIWYDHNGVIKSDNGFCLDVPNDPGAAADVRGSVVYLKSCANDEYDRWDYVVEYDKSVKIVNDFTGYCLYPYQRAEGAIANASEGQLVQRPCDARYGQNWKMRIIPKQKWFQLEAVDNKKKPTNTCMVADKRNPTDQQVRVFVKDCSPQTRGRWEFGHWKGTYQWTEWTDANAAPGGVENLSTTYWVSADSLKAKNNIGVCRVVLGNQDAGNHSIYAGTWRGTMCSYLANGRVQNLDPSQPGGNDIVVEVLTGLDIGVPGATASWKSSAGGIPTDPQGQNKTPPAPSFSAFLVGGDTTHTATYLCRVKQKNMWSYGYQADGIGCMTDAGANVRTEMQVLVFATVKNQDTSN